MHKPNHLALLAAATLAAGLGLAGCQRHESDQRTAGEKVDATIAKTERKTDELQADASRAMDKAADKMSRGTEAARNKVDDAAITTAVNAELAKDPKLSALAIDVDTANGKVALHGHAPDAAAKDRATQLASGVKGVESVDNQLVVKNP